MNYFVTLFLTTFYVMLANGNSIDVDTTSERMESTFQSSTIVQSSDEESTPATTLDFTEFTREDTTESTIEETFQSTFFYSLLTIKDKTDESTGTSESTSEITEVSTESSVESSTEYSTEYLETTKGNEEKFDFSSLFYDSTSDSSANISEQAAERNEIIELTSQFHKMRVKLVNYTHVIEAQQKLITKLAETVRDLEKEVTKLKATNEKESKELNDKNKKCRNDFNNLMHELKAAKKLLGMEKYSKELRSKLKEFGVLDTSKRITSNKTTVKFSVFEIETDAFSGKILSNRKLFILPPNLGGIVANISELSATNVGMVIVNRNAFNEMSQLKVLNLSQNDISLIESESFKNLMELRKLDLSRNKIEFISKAFKGLKELEDLNLSFNKLTYLPTDTFDVLLNLKVLNLNYNQIRELSGETFTDINVIEEFYLIGNQIEVINPINIRYFEVAKIIDLRQNSCIDQRFPDNLTMIQLMFEVLNCWNKI